MLSHRCGRIRVRCVCDGDVMSETETSDKRPVPTSVEICRYLSDWAVHRGAPIEDVSPVLASIVGDARRALEALPTGDLTAEIERARVAQRGADAMRRSLREIASLCRAAEAGDDAARQALAERILTGPLTDDDLWVGFATVGAQVCRNEHASERVSIVGL